MPYEWEEWGLLALAAAGIEPYEVRQVIEAKRRWPRSATHPRTGLQVLTIWGRTSAGRGLIVAVHHTTGHTWKIIGARDMTPAELAEFGRWEETP